MYFGLCLSGKIMKILILLVFSIAFGGIAYAQLTHTASAVVKHNDRDVVKCYFDTMIQEPCPVGGLATFYKFMVENMQYPLPALLAGKEGTMIVRFTVTEKGLVEDLSIMEGRALGYGLDEEAIRLIKLTKWLPAINEAGNDTSYLKAMPVKFKLPQ